MSACRRVSPAGCTLSRAQARRLASPPAAASSQMGSAVVPKNGACTTPGGEAEANRLGQQLREWVTEAGGYVHPALQLSLHTPHGYRGVVAREAISLEAARHGPFIAVPERCLLTTEAAVRLLGPQLQRRQRQRQQAAVQQQQPPRQPWWAALAPGRLPLAPQQAPQLPPPEMLLALLLAAERRRGPASEWWPYIAALPEQLPCAWALPAQQLRAELAALGSLATGWGPQVQAAAAAVEQRTEAAAHAWGEQLGGLTAGDIRWALGHTLSRCFGSGDDLALLPFIDLCNHRQHADQPQGHTSAAGEPCAAVCSRHQGEEQALDAGAELCISYVAGTSPLQMFLTFGFVPAEHRGLEPS